MEGWSRCALLLGAPGRSIAGHGGCNLACQRPWAVRTPMLLGSLRRVGLAQDMKGGPGYRGVPPASHYIPPGLLLTPSLVGRRSADSVRTVRGVNGNAARGLVEGWSRCALLLAPPPSREAPAAEEEQRWGWTSTCSVLSVIVASQAASEKPV